MGDSGGLVETTRRAFVEKAFGTDFIKALKDRGLTTRDLYELSSPTTQCNNIKGLGPCITPDCKCWLCGLTIFLDENGHQTDRRENIGDRFTPECEHVLPVMQAVLVLGGLYSERVRRADDGWWNHISKFFPLEYKWSHSICNNIKDENLFFDDNGIIRDKLIEIYLNKIYSKLNLPLSKAEWMAERKRAIKTVLQPIVDYYNKRRTEDGNLFLLSSAAVGVHAVVNLPSILEEGNKVRTFMELWQPEIIPTARTYSNGQTIPIRTITVEEYIKYINEIPFNNFYDYMKELSTKRNERRYLVADNYLVFYQNLFYTDVDRVSKITQLDIKLAIMAHYLSKERINFLISEIITFFGNDSNNAQVYIVPLYYYIINRKILARCEELHRRGINTDPAFIVIVNKESNTNHEVLNHYNSDLTKHFEEQFFPPTGGYRKKRGRKQTRRRFRKVRKTRRS
jgi:hypothetical protein